MAQTNPRPATASGTFTIGGDLTVYRLGFGAMRLAGPGIWGPPRDKNEAIAVLRRAIELGVNLIDTADSYGPEVSEALIAEALYPYPSNLVIATKGGYLRPGPGQWHPDGHPAHLREALEGSLRRLRLERIDIYQFHVPDPNVPYEESIGALADLREAGKIRHIGVSNVNTDQLARARKIVPIVTVQNLYNLTDRSSEGMVDICEREGLGFIPWFPLATGDLANGGGKLKQIAQRHHATPGQIALAWLLRRSTNMLPIPGTSSVRHLEEDLAAAEIRLSDAEFQALDEGV
ncbi:MAG TPA: aldo/keto reductase [Ktedonobacteraceae bacterium]|jgi:pyridoxine 4-dehydrogenase|nr:aldo/keto reductase [Ktedonobacteraceae bacterium]